MLIKCFFTPLSRAHSETLHFLQACSESRTFWVVWAISQISLNASLSESYSEELWVILIKGGKTLSFCLPPTQQEILFVFAQDFHLWNVEQSVCVCERVELLRDGSKPPLNGNKNIHNFIIGLQKTFCRAFICRSVFTTHHVSHQSFFLTAQFSAGGEVNYSTLEIRGWGVSPSGSSLWISLWSRRALDVQIMILQQHSNEDPGLDPAYPLLLASSLRNHRGFKGIHTMQNQLAADPLFWCFIQRKVWGGDGQKQTQKVSEFLFLISKIFIELLD